MLEFTLRIADGFEEGSHEAVTEKTDPGPGRARSG